MKTLAVANKSLGKRLFWGILVFAIVLSTSALVASYVYFKARTDSYYKNMGRMILHTAVVGLNPNEALSYRKSLVEDARYASICEALVQVRSAHPEVRRLYMMYFTEQGGVYIYDAEKTSERNALGQTEKIEDYYEIKTAALIGEKIPNRVLNKKEGAFLSMSQPIFTSKDSLVGYLIADLPMHQIMGERKDFLWKVSLPLFGLSLLWCAFFFLWLYIRVISPIRVISRAIKNDTLQTGEGSEVHTGDEIESLYYLIQKREKSMATSFSALFKKTWKREHDALTELYNKEKFESLEGTEYKSLSSVGIIYVDINNLKMLNEIYGRPVGDIVIKKTARHVDRFLEDHSQGFRMGGDEFLIVCPNIAEGVFINIVQLLKDSSPALNRSSDAVHCSLAIGYSFAEEPVNLEDVMAHAEMAMYAEKKRIKEEQNLQNG